MVLPIKPGKYTAINDNIPDDSDELEVKVGNIIEVIANVNDEWLEGKTNGKTGIFPRYCVDESKPKNVDAEYAVPHIHHDTTNKLPTDDKVKKLPPGAIDVFKFRQEPKPVLKATSGESGENTQLSLKLSSLPGKPLESNKASPEQIKSKTMSNSPPTDRVVKSDSPSVKARTERILNPPTFTAPPPPPVSAKPKFDASSHKPTDKEKEPHQPVPSNKTPNNKVMPHSTLGKLSASDENLLAQTGEPSNRQVKNEESDDESGDESSKPFKQREGGLLRSYKKPKQKNKRPPTKSLLIKDSEKLSNYDDEKLPGSLLSLHVATDKADKKDTSISKALAHQIPTNKSDDDSSNFPETKSNKLFAKRGTKPSDEAHNTNVESERGNNIKAQKRDMLKSTQPDTTTIPVQKLPAHSNNVGPPKFISKTPAHSEDKKLGLTQPRDSKDKEVLETHKSHEEIHRPYDEFISSRISDLEEFASLKADNANLKKELDMLNLAFETYKAETNARLQEIEERLKKTKLKK